MLTTDTGDDAPDVTTIPLNLDPPPATADKTVGLADETTSTNPHFGLVDVSGTPMACPPAEPPPRVSSLMPEDRVARLIIPRDRPIPATDTPKGLVTYHLPLEKARRTSPITYIPQGSIMDPNIMD